MKEERGVKVIRIDARTLRLFVLLISIMVFLIINIYFLNK